MKLSAILSLTILMALGGSSEARPYGSMEALEARANPICGGFGKFCDKFCYCNDPPTGHAADDATGVACLEAGGYIDRSTSIQKCGINNDQFQKFYDFCSQYGDNTACGASKRSSEEQLISARATNFPKNKRYTGLKCQCVNTRGQFTPNDLATETACVRDYDNYRDGWCYGVLSSQGWYQRCLATGGYGTNCQEE